MFPLPRAGQIVGRYRLVRQIGRGSFGDVYLADQLAPDGTIQQPAVLKVLHPQWAQVPQVLERFRRESLVTRKFEHPHVARVFDNGQTDEGVPYIAMEYLPGPSLRQELTRGPFPLARALSILWPIADALAAAHRAGVVHRDLKPENILLITKNGRRDQPVILDFGVAKFLDAAERLTMTGAVLGTPAYMSPEQFRGEHDLGPPADVYALGVLIFELCSGGPPFAGRNFAELALSHTSAPPPPLGGVPKEIARVVERCLGKEPARRPTAEEVAQVLRRSAAAEAVTAQTAAMETVVIGEMPVTIVADTIVEAVPPAIAAHAPSEPRRGRLVRILGAAAATLLLCAILLLSYYLFPR